MPDDPHADTKHESLKRVMIKHLNAADLNGAEMVAEFERHILAAVQTRVEALPDALQGDGPCFDCHTNNNIIWFAESAFWNSVMDVRERILCIPCFVKRAYSRGHKSSWQLMPVSGGGEFVDRSSEVMETADEQGPEPEEQA